jgi:uncharacterized membrane protein YfbV (UPF0208 family)
MEPKEDGGFASRKFIFCVVVAGVIVAVGILAGTVLPGIAAVLTEIYGGLLGVLGLYLTGNISSTYLSAKAAAITSKAPTKLVAGKKLPVAPDAPEDES